MVAYVYIYCDPRTKLPFYVGKGTGNRWKDHLVLCDYKSASKRLPHFYAKLRKMLREGTRPQIVKVFEGSERACFQTERTLIQSYGRKCDGGPLCNLTDGGEGSCGLKVSDETRKKQSEAATGRRDSLETRAKKSKASLGRTLSPESRRKISERKLGKPRPVDMVKRMSESRAKDPSYTIRCRRLAQAQRTPVEAFNPETGETIHSFESQLATKEFGFHHGHVNDVLNGRCKTHKGLGWRYTDEG